MHGPTSLYVSDYASFVELHLGVAGQSYGEHIEGEGADIALLRSRETHKVVGATLPLYNSELVISHFTGQVEVNGRRVMSREEELASTNFAVKQGVANFSIHLLQAIATGAEPCPYRDARFVAAWYYGFYLEATRFLVQLVEMTVKNIGNLGERSRLPLKISI